MCVCECEQFVPLYSEKNSSLFLLDTDSPVFQPAAEMLVVEGWFVNTEFVRLFWFCIVMYFRLGTRMWAFLFSFGEGGNPT